MSWTKKYRFLMENIVPDMTPPCQFLISLEHVGQEVACSLYLVFIS
jgi:hypothetical protein